MRRILSYVAFALLWVSAVQAQEVYVDNVVVLLDASGSMNSAMRGMSVSRLEAAKSAIKEVLTTIPASTHVGLLVFGGSTHEWVYPLGPRDDSALLPTIDRLDASGGTPLGEYLKKAGDRLLQARQAQYGYGSYRLLAVTDGEAGDKALVDRFTPDIMSRGIVLDVIGVDMTKRHTLATMVHSYRSADNPESLKTAIQEVFAEVGKDAGGDSSLDKTFAELDGFPAELVKPMIDALSSSGNHPIGIDPSVEQASPPGKVEVSTQSSQSTTSSSSSSTSTSGKSNTWKWIVFIVVWMILSTFGRRKKKR